MEPTREVGTGPDGDNTLRDNTGGVNTVVGLRAAVPVHAARPTRTRYRQMAALCGLLATAAAVTVGGMALVQEPSDGVSAGPASANLITVDPRIPLSPRDLSALLLQAPAFGELADPKRRASCLNGLGYPGSMHVLGAAPIQVNGQAAVVLVLPGDHPDELVALAVSPNCSSMATGLIADTTVPRS